MAVIVDRREFESERGPKWPRWRCLAGEIRLAARAAEVDAADAEQRVKLVEQFVAGKKRIGELLGPDLDDPTHAVERADPLELDQIVEKPATQTHLPILVKRVLFAMRTMKRRQLSSPRSS